MIQAASMLKWETHPEHGGQHVFIMYYENVHLCVQSSFSVCLYVCVCTLWHIIYVVCTDQWHSVLSTPLISSMVVLRSVPSCPREIGFGRWVVGLGCANCSCSSCHKVFNSCPSICLFVCLSIYPSWFHNYFFVVIITFHWLDFDAIALYFFVMDMPIFSCIPQFFR